MRCDDALTARFIAASPARLRHTAPDPDHAERRSTGRCLRAAGGLPCRFPEVFQPGR
jgi:hypothetical protein